MSDQDAINDIIMEDLLMEESQLEQDEQNDIVDVETQARQSWVLFMRSQFSVRPEFPSTATILKPDGRLNQEYFRPKLEAPSSKERIWTDVEKDLLIQGIEKHGVGNWSTISKEFLAEWTPNELRLKCVRLIGRQNLQLYKNWKGNASEISQEYQNNKRIGLEHDSWKQGVLVYDDNGEIEKELLEYHHIKQIDS